MPTPASLTSFCGNFRFPQIQAALVVTLESCFSFQGAEEATRFREVTAEARQASTFSAALAAVSTGVKFLPLRLYVQSTGCIWPQALQKIFLQLSSGMGKRRASSPEHTRITWSCHSETETTQEACGNDTNQHLWSADVLGKSSTSLRRRATGT